MDIFEKNAAEATERLQETTDTAISTIQGGAATSSGEITDSSNAAIASLRAGETTGRADITTARDRATQALLDAFGLQKEEINKTAIASSGIISAARIKAIDSIVSGFSDAKTSIKSARDISNKILQDAETTAEGKLDVARASAIAAQDRGVAAVRSDFQPYIDAGKLTLENVSELINNPQAQKEFITNNPFFDALAKRSEDALLKAKAAVGKVGTGGTQIELQNEMLAIGNQLLDAQIGRSLPLVSGGQNAASEIAASERLRADAISRIEQSTGQSLAQLVQTTAVNRANIETTAGRDIADLDVGQGKETASVETQAGKDLASIESQRGADIANATATNAAQVAQTELNAGTNLANIATSTAGKVAGVEETAGINKANINTAATDAQAKLESNLGINQANILTGNAANTAEVLIGQGNAIAAGKIGGADQIKQGLLDLSTIALNPAAFNNPIKGTP